MSSRWFSRKKASAPHIALTRVVLLLSSSTPFTAPGSSSLRVLASRVVLCRERLLAGSRLASCQSHFRLRHSCPRSVGQFRPTSRRRAHCRSRPSRSYAHDARCPSHAHRRVRLAIRLYAFSVVDADARPGRNAGPGRRRFLVLHCRGLGCPHRRLHGPSLLKEQRRRRPEPSLNDAQRGAASACDARRIPNLQGH